MGLWSLFKEILEAFYYIAGVGLFGTLIVAVKQLRLLKKDLQDRNQRAAVEKSLEYLHFYSAEFLPARQQYINKLKSEIESFQDISHLKNKEFKVKMDSLSKEILAETIVRDQMGALDLMNRLEFFSTAMLNGVADESIVFTPVARNFCDIVEQEFILISLTKQSGDAPFKNLVELYNKWHNKIELEKLSSEKVEMEKKMSQLDKSITVKPPIGF